VNILSRQHSRSLRPSRWRRHGVAASALLGALFFGTSAATTFAADTLSPVIEVDEEVYAFEPANNGAEPLWDYGSTNLVRLGSDVFASGLETLKGVPPQNNTRCVILRRGDKSWAVVWRDAGERTREPCPIAVLPAEGHVVMSTNPAVGSPTKGGGSNTNPGIVSISGAKPSDSETLHPAWNASSATPVFNEHSYRSLAADASNNELLLVQHVGNTDDYALWTFRDKQGDWSANGRLAWPLVAQYNHGKPLRISYPNVAIRGTTMHFVGVSDVVEPNEEWHKYKKALTGQDWDYAFRHLYYTWSKDIATGKFEHWIELSSREDTEGRITPGDLWLAPDGAAHIVWVENAIEQPKLRDKFFPDRRQRYELNYAIVRDGVVVLRKTLASVDEGKIGWAPRWAKLHAAPDNRLFVVFYVESTGRRPQQTENRVLEVLADGSATPAVRLPLAQPLGIFVTATERAGSKPSRFLDLLGMTAYNATKVRYARVRLF
jgi:hypothetical protein